MSSYLGREPYAGVPYGPNPTPPYNSFTDALHNDALMSPSFAYPDPNEGLWRLFHTLPQLFNATNVPSHDGFAPTTSVNHPAAYVSPTQPAMSITTPPSTHDPIEPLATQESHTPRSSAPSSELHLCKTCCAAVQALVSYGTTIHLVLDSCTICHGTSSAPETNNDGAETSRARSVVPDISPTLPTITHQRPRSNQRRANKRKRLQSSPSQIPAVRAGPFRCRHEGCNRGPGGRSFARKDNRNVHERTVHGETPEED